jgi:hypothetical protein
VSAILDSDRAALVLGDCIETMKALAEGSVDAVVTDPPYELGFMGKKWDATGIAFDPETWRAAFRVLKPGGHLLAFGGSRTFHRIACAIEDAGFEVRDTLSWLYGTGFPKSLDVSKAIDAAAGAERKVVGPGSRHGGGKDIRGGRLHAASEGAADGYGAGVITAPATDAARAWEGWGTALKPAWEPVILARKPLAGTVAANVLAHGTGALNIDGCRIATTENLNGGAYSGGERPTQFLNGGLYRQEPSAFIQPSGRWPANVCLDEEAAAVLDAQSGTLKSGAWNGNRNTSKTMNVFGEYESRTETPRAGDSGGASRFFYVAKASRSERDEGCESLPRRTGGEATGREDGSAGAQTPGAGAGRTGGARNIHPTVKPITLMRWLVRLVTPPGGCVLDPFTGSGSTGVAALAEGFAFIGCEQSPEYIEIAKARIEHALKQAMPIRNGIDTEEAA